MSTESPAASPNGKQAVPFFHVTTCGHIAPLLHRCPGLCGHESMDAAGPHPLVLA